MSHTNLNSERAKFRQIFDHLSTRDSAIRGCIEDEEYLNLTDRLFESRSDDRWFIVDYAPDTDFDGFRKEALKNDSAQVLYFFATARKSDAIVLWEYYKDWMESRLSVQDMDDRLSLHFPDVK